MGIRLAAPGGTSVDRTGTVSIRRQSVGGDQAFLLMKKVVSGNRHWLWKSKFFKHLLQSGLVGVLAVSAGMGSIRNHPAFVRVCQVMVHLLAQIFPVSAGHDL